MAHAVPGLLLESDLSGAAGGEISPNLLSLVPRVGGQEIQALLRERLVPEVVVKTDDWQGDALPYRHEWLVPGSEKEAPKVPP